MGHQCPTNMGPQGGHREDISAAQVSAAAYFNITRAAVAAFQTVGRWWPTGTGLSVTDSLLLVNLCHFHVFSIISSKTFKKETNQKMPSAKRLLENL